MVLVTLAIASIVFISGCVDIGETEVETGDGVEITSFETYPTSVYSDETYEIVMDVENRGGREARGVEACLYDPKVDRRAYSIGTLERSTEDLQGGRGTAVWEREAGDVAAGITTSETPRARLFYGYNTIGNKNIQVVSRDEASRRERDGEQPVPDPETTTVSEGPFDVDITSSGRRITEGDRTVRFDIEARNVGQGTPFAEELDEDDFVGDIWDFIICDILDWCDPEGDGVGGYDTESCSIDQEHVNRANLKLQVEGAELVGDCADLENGELVRIRDGRLWKSCRMEVDEVVPQQGISVQASIGYGYSLDAETSVTIQGE